MSVRKNLVANYFGQGWAALIGLAFIPVYIHYLGVEGYGLIGFYALLQTVFVLVDSGLSTAVAREVARCHAKVAASSSFPTAFGKIEWIYAGLALSFAVLVWVSADWISQNWVSAKQVQADIVKLSVVWMAAAVGLLVQESLYRAVMVGSQRQALLNVFLVSSSTARALGAVALLAWLAADIVGYFIWQTVVSAITVVVMGTIARRQLKSYPHVSSHEPGYLKTLWHFSSGTIATTVLAAILTQTDKLLLSKLLSLEAFGYYSLAATVAAAIYQFVKPITQAYYPRYAELVAAGKVAELATTYHRSAQLCALTTLPVTALLVFFGNRLLLAWTGNTTVADYTAPLLVWLALGTLLNGLMNMPYMLQLAYGWSRFSAWANFVAVILLLPMILWVVPRYGALGAAVCWFLLNVGYVLIATPLMHRHLLPGERMNWLIGDVSVPIVMAMVIGAICRWLYPGNFSVGGDLLWMATSAMLTGVATLAVLSVFRARLQNFVAPWLGRNR